MGAWHGGAHASCGGLPNNLIFNERARIEEARQLSYDCGANQKAGTMGGVYFQAFAAKFDLELVRTSNVDEMLRCLHTGGVGVLVGGDHDDYHGVFSDRWMHWMVAVSEERDGRICILDPAYEESCYEKGDRKGKVEVISRGFSRVSVQVLLEETAAVERGGFCLFWRKQGSRVSFKRVRQRQPHLQCERPYWCADHPGRGTH